MKSIITLIFAAIGSFSIYTGIIPASNETFSMFNTLSTFLLITGLMFINSQKTAIHYAGITMFGLGAGMSITKSITLNGNYTYAIILGVIAVVAFIGVNITRKPEVNKSE